MNKKLNFKLNIQIIRNTVIFLIICILIILWVIFFKNPISPIFLSGDSWINLFFAELYNLTWQFRYENMSELKNINEIELIFSPRDWTTNVDNYLVPDKFLWFITIIWTFIKIIGWNIINIYNIFVFIWVILVLGLIWKELNLNEKQQIIIMICAWLMSTLIYFNFYDFLETSSWVFVFLLTILYYLKYIKYYHLCHSNKYFYLFSRFLWFLIFIRPDNLLFILPIVIFHIITLIHKKKIIQSHSIAFLIFLISISPFLISNYITYWWILTIWQSLISDLWNERIILPGLFFGNDFFNFFLNAYYLLKNEIIFLISIILISTNLLNKNFHNFKYYNYFWFYLLISTFIYLAFIWTGKIISNTSVLFDNSMMRYFIWIYLLSIIYFIKFINQLFHNIFLKYLILIVIILNSFVNTHIWLLKYFESLEKNSDLIKFVQSFVNDDNTIILSSKLSQSMRIMGNVWSLKNLRSHDLLNSFDRELYLFSLIEQLLKKWKNVILDFTYLDLRELDVDKFINLLKKNEIQFEKHVNSNQFLLTIK
jgi:hypothetical protein